MDIETGRRFLEACRQLYDATDGADRAVAAFLGVHRSDLRCLQLVATGERTSSDIAAALGLASGSVTALVDRLERAGFAKRVASTTDRRSAVVVPTARGRKRLRRLEEVAAAPILAALAGHADDEIARCRSLIVAVASGMVAASAALEADVRGDA